MCIKIDPPTVRCYIMERNIFNKIYALTVKKNVIYVQKLFAYCFVLYSSFDKKDLYYFTWRSHIFDTANYHSGLTEEGISLISWPCN